MNILYCVVIFIVGLMLGSFYACMGYRIPNKISLLKPRSFCESCKKPLKWYMNIPVISFILLKGRCAYCKERIDFTSLFIELFTALTLTWAYICYGFSYQFYIVIILISALSVTAVTDFRYYYVSDRVVFTSTALLIGINIYFKEFSEYKDNLIAMVAMFLLLLVIKFIGDKVFKRECLGGGDIKLMLLVGISLGLINSFVALFFASLLALVSALILNEKYNDNLIPFGPFIILATIMVFSLSQAGYLF